MKRYVVLGLGLLAACGGPTTSPEHESSSGDEAVESTREATAQPPGDAPAPVVTAPRHGPLGEDDLHRGILARLRDPRFPSCTASPLPPALRRRVRTPSAPPGEVAMTVPEGTLAAMRVGARELAVYSSTRLDPSSELGDVGYRVRIRHPDGREEDLSLGLTALRPWVLVANPGVPMLDDEGVLQLEAELRALDDASVDFSPAEGTSTRRDGREYLVRCALDDLRRDQDGDGLTDLEEERLLTDAWDRDTDGDGIDDGQDRSPLGHAATTAPTDALWAAAYRTLIDPGEGLRIVVRSGARLQLDGDPERDGVVLMLREDELGAYHRRFGRRAPLVLTVQMRNERRAEVVIDSVWSERSYDALQDATDTWRFTERVRPAPRPAARLEDRR